jgi:lauroyl/myristoyl acyltransferase
MPLWLGYLLSHWRGKLNARLARDWRSVALETRHIQRQSMAGYAQLPNPGTEAQRAQWCQQRFATEARDEFEAQLVAARRLHALQCTFLPAGSEILTNNSDRGLVLLTPHFDSFYLGIAFLAQASGKRLNSMSSAVTKDPRVTPAVGLHFDRKYRGLEQYLHGGKVPDMEGGLRPFYRMLERRETLVVLGDAPVLPNGVSMEVDFLGARRMLAGGALRLAQQTGSDLGAFICRYVRPGQYALEICAAGPADDPQTLTRVYAFMGQHIAQDPGLWWASDLLPHMTPVEPIEAKNASAD